jgi:hypothetical protein
MTYERVFPRDLFNDANLLKCLGQLVLKIEDGVAPKGLYVEQQERDAIDIWQDASDGSTYANPANFNLYLELKPGLESITLHRPLNARGSFPLLAYNTAWDEPVQVFDAMGNFHPDFLNGIEILKKRFKQ